MSSSCSVTIYQAFSNTVIAFNNSGVVLKDRSCSDLIDLGIMARQSNNPELLKLFESLPSLPELQIMKMKELEKKIFKSNATTQNNS